jgi:hypothetical protein
MVGFARYLPRLGVLKTYQCKHRDLLPYQIKLLASFYELVIFTVY